MTTGDTYANLLLAHIYQNAALPGIGDASGLQPSAVAGSLYISLHTAAVAVGGDQTTNEANYTGYARKAVVRSNAGWTVANRAASNAAQITPNNASGNHQTITHVCIGIASAGSGMVLHCQALDTSYITNTGTLPPFAVGSLQVSL